MYSIIENVNALPDYISKLQIFDMANHHDCHLYSIQFNLKTKTRQVFEWYRSRVCACVYDV